MPDTVPEKRDPQDAEFRLPQAQPRRFRRGPLIAVVCLIVGLIFIAFSIAMLRTPSHLTAENEGINPADASRLPDFVRTGPKDYSEIPQPIEPLPPVVPKIGPPLAGDLGAAGVPAQTTTLHPDGAGANRTLSPEEQQRRAKRLAAREADVFLPGFTDKKSQSTSELQPDPRIAQHKALLDRKPYTPDLAALTDKPSSWASQNRQAQKKDFLKTTDANASFYLKTAVAPALSRYEVKSGSILPTTLITGINSELPGQIIGQIRENVFDTVTGQHLLIPQGTRLIGEYDSALSFGQERVLVVWRRLTLPNGSSINLEGMPGVDLTGFAGFEDRVDKHWLELAGGVILSSILSVGVTYSTGNFTNSNIGLPQALATSVGRDLNRTGQQIVDKMLNRQPTLTIAPGFAVNVFVNKDMILEPYDAQRGAGFVIDPTTNQSGS